MASNTVMIKNLQKAINARGEKILYQTSQFYSEKEDRPVTVYYVKKAIWNGEKNRNQNIELFKSTSQIQIVLYLRDYWYELNNWKVPDDNPTWTEAKKKYYSKQEQET